MKRIKRFREGEPIPENATLIRTEYEKGRYLGERYVGSRGVFPFGFDYYQNVYEQIPVYIYEVNEDSDAERP